MESAPFTDADICDVDLFVKSRLVKDTISLVKKKKDTVIALDDYGCLSKIHPQKEGESESEVDMYKLIC